MAIQHIHTDNNQAQAASAPRREQTIINLLSRFAVSLGDFMLQHWATCLTAMLGIVVFLAISVPFLFYFGLDDIARQIYFSLHLVCAQIPSHSFYVYGHPLGLCERNFSVYSSMFLGGLAFVLSKKRLPGIPWWLWILMILPMAIDGVTQMFGLRESTFELRIITGTLFGLANMWFILPLVQRNIVYTSPEEPSAAYAYGPANGTPAYATATPRPQATEAAQQTSIPVEHDAL